MEKPERGIIQTDPRHITRRIRTAIQGNVIRALVELITNSDDSYTRLEEEGVETEGKIEIVYKKEGYCGLFAVRDFAEGMSINDVRESFKKYGAATSGLNKGKKVRGYFGQGAKDALAGMDEGKICTFKDGEFVECKLFIENGQPMYEIYNPEQATQKLRDIHKIYNDGTIAYFKTNPNKWVRTPKINTVHEELANNFLLRKIMVNPKRKITLIDENSKESRQLKYKMPLGKEILSDNFVILPDDEWEKYGEFHVNISIWRSEIELNQTGDSRQGGLLITDDEGIVLDISLFKFENEPLASHLFGEVKIGNFRKMLENEEPVLREERDGLVRRHPFCQKLIEEIEKRLETVINEEKLRKQKEEQGKIDSEEASRYKKAFKILNEIAEQETQEVIKLGEKGANNLEEPPNGMCLYPFYAQITIGKRYGFELRLNTKVVSTGSLIKITCDNQKIKVITPEIKILPDDGNGILSKYVTVEGLEPNIEGVIRASFKNISSEAKVYVAPEKEMLLSEGMVFQPESITLRPNQPKTVYLLVYIKMIGGGSKIKVYPDKDSVHVLPEEINVAEVDSERNIAKYEIKLWGEGIGEDAIVTAEYENYVALLDVRIRIKEEKGEEGRKGMFSEPEFNFESEPLQRSLYSPETGKVIIYVNFPSVKHYIGENCQYRKTLPAQVLIADLAAERCFYEIAKKKVDSSSALIRPETRSDKIQSEAYMLSRKYGKKVHEMLVDQSLLDESKKTL